ncbi:MAG: hypothetical protein ACREBI_10915 [Nitrosotalea sp.]
MKTDYVETYIKILTDLESGSNLNYSYYNHVLHGQLTQCLELLKKNQLMDYRNYLDSCMITQKGSHHLYAYNKILELLCKKQRKKEAHVIA